MRGVRAVLSLFVLLALLVGVPSAARATRLTDHAQVMDAVGVDDPPDGVADLAEQATAIAHVLIEVFVERRDAGEPRAVDHRSILVRAPKTSPPRS